jgi:hypothetical protein
MVVLGILLPTMTGCLLKETTHTLYLEPNGAVVWRVVEKDVRSDAEDEEARHEEELEYLAAARSGKSGIAMDFDELGALRIDTQLISDRRPFFVVIDAAFASIEDLALAILEETCPQGSADLEFGGDRASFIARCPLDDRDGASSETLEEDTVGFNLIDDADCYRVVLTAGRFVDATGFDLDADDTALLRDLSDEELAANDDVAIFALTWELP